jgi:hypothetical protein
VSNQIICDSCAQPVRPDTDGTEWIHRDSWHYQCRVGLNGNPVATVDGSTLVPVARRVVVLNQSSTTFKSVQAYLPDNYQARIQPFGGPSGGAYVEIIGIDVAGWTLDGYVIPRLASALIIAAEIPRGSTPSEVANKGGAST